MITPPPVTVPVGRSTAEAASNVTKALQEAGLAASFEPLMEAQVFPLKHPVRVDVWSRTSEVEL